MTRWSQIMFQDAISPIIEEIIFFHDTAIIVLVGVIGVVGIRIGFIVRNLLINSRVLERQLLECVWTVIPALILVEIAVPSLMLLYIIDEVRDRIITLKITGYQWYWTYEYSDFWVQDRPFILESYMSKDMGKDDSFRLLDVDNRVVLPLETSVRLLITSADVLHSWALPTAGLKIDACPGRLNQLNFYSYRSGVYFGQCSEICGANHRFIPISVEVVPVTRFMSWLRFLEG